MCRMTKLQAISMLTSPTLVRPAPLCLVVEKSPVLKRSKVSLNSLVNSKALPRKIAN
jgi:hypothetical protein